MIDTKALRQKILDMAIKGKLVPQDPNDEPASVLLERIRAEKQQLIKEGKIKKDKNDSVIFKGDDNRYYENLPTGWSVSTLSQITSSQLLNDGDWILSENMVPNGDVKLIQLGSIGSMCYIDKGFKYLTEDTFHELSCVQIFSGYMLINRIISDKMYACILPRLDGKLITTFDTCWIAPKDKWYNLKYLMYFISSTAFQSIVLHVSSGTTRKRISKSDLIHLPICFPPLSEQQRIVTRIDELFAQVDIIEQNQADIDKLYDEFRKRTLTLAIQGKLVPQNPNDEPASVLLERIRAEKKAKLGKKYVDSYIYKGDDNCYYEKIKDSLKEISDEIPFDVPESWQWVRIDNLFQHNTGKALNSSNTKGVLHPYITTSNVYWGYFSLDRVKEMPFTEDEFAKCSIFPGDLLVCEGGDVGRAAIWDKDIPMCIQNHIHRLRAYYPVCTAFYYFAFFVYKSIGLIGGKGIGIQGLSSGTLGKLIFPLPPLTEQERIVKQVEIILEKLKDEA